MSTEEWRPIAWTDGWYDVSSSGRVRSWYGRTSRGIGGGSGAVNERAATPRVLTPRLSSAGYCRQALTLDGVSRGYSIHRLVAEAFVGHAPEGMQVCHNDGIRTNNHPGNLRWGTPKENQGDRRAHGTAPQGSQHGRARLSEADVVEMRNLARAGTMRSPDIARRFGVGTYYGRQVIRGDRWAHLPGGVR